MPAFTFTCEHIIHVFEYESSTLEPGLEVCMGHRHENGGELSERVFSCVIWSCTYEWDLNV